MIQSSPFKPPSSSPVAPSRSVSPFRPPAQAAPAATTQNPFAVRPDAVEIGSARALESVPPATPELTRRADSSAWQAAVAALPAPLQAAFHHVSSVLDGLPENQEQLGQLLGQGVLLQKDTEKTVLERLQEFTEESRVQGMDGRILTAETVRLLADPDSAFQGTRCTCGPANLQHQLALNAPAVLTELIEGLSDPKGVAPLPSGVLIERVPESQYEDGAGRSSADRILQSAFMGVAGSERGAYSMETGCFGDDPVPGVKPLELAKLTALATNTDQVVVIHDSTTSRGLYEVVQNLEPGESFQCGLGWNGRDHLLLLKGYSEGQVSYFDPERQRTEQMPIRDFLYKTQFVLLPADKLQGLNLPEDKQYRVELSH